MLVPKGEGLSSIGVQMQQYPAIAAVGAGNRIGVAVGGADAFFLAF